MSETLYTIKQIADIVKVSKITMYRFIKANSFQETLTKRNAMMYNETTKNLIIKAFNNKSVATASETTETVSYSDKSMMILEEQVSNQNKQLLEKDEQIKQLHKLLDQQQQLSLQDKSQLIELKERIAELEGLISTNKDDKTENNRNVPSDDETLINDFIEPKKKWFHFWK